MHTTDCMSAYSVEIEARLRCMHAYTNFPSIAERSLKTTLSNSSLSAKEPVGLLLQATKSFDESLAYLVTVS